MGWKFIIGQQRKYVQVHNLCTVLIFHEVNKCALETVSLVVCICYTAHTYLLFSQSEEFEVYINYAGTYMSAVTALEDMLNLKTEAVKYLKVSYACYTQHTILQCV